MRAIERGGGFVVGVGGTEDLVEISVIISEALVYFRGGEKGDKRIDRQGESSAGV